MGRVRSARQPPAAGGCPPRLGRPQGVAGPNQLHSGPRFWLLLFCPADAACWPSPPPALPRFVELTGSEELDVEQLARLATPRTRLISLVHVSNMLGCMLPVHKVAEIAERSGARVLLDCCQSGG